MVQAAAQVLLLPHELGASVADGSVAVVEEARPGSRLRGVRNAARSHLARRPDRNGAVAAAAVGRNGTARRARTAIIRPRRVGRARSRATANGADRFTVPLAEQNGKAREVHAPGETNVAR